MDVAFEQQLEKDKIRKIRHENIPKLFTKKKKSVHKELLSRTETCITLRYTSKFEVPSRNISSKKCDFVITFWFNNVDLCSF